MNTPASVFDQAIDKWIDNENRPWSRLKIDLTRMNLKRHLPDKLLRILDAGGGMGTDSLPLASEGHQVDLVDYSPAMLALAKRDVAAADLTVRVTLHQGDVTAIQDQFAPSTFDAVLCHNVLQYLDDVPALLRSLSATLKPGGFISLIGMNRYALPWRAALLRNDLDEAYETLDAHTEMTQVFGHAVTVYSRDEIEVMLPQAGLVFDGYYGIRCLNDYWGDNERKANPETWAKLKRLEFAMTDRHPYNLLARFWQIIAHKVE